MLSRTTLRPTTARLAYTASLAVLCMLGCANRGMVAPQGEGGVSTGGTGGAIKTDGGAGTGGHGGGAGGGSGGKGGGSGGGAGSGGKGGASGAPGKDAGCSLLADASVEHSTTSCNALYNFESGIEGATVANSGTQLAFTGLIKSGTQTYCGTGALAITAHFSGSTGLSTKGEVDLPLGTDGGNANLNGKTITVHISANPACDPGLKLTVAVIGASGAEQFPARNVLVTANWTTVSATVSADGGADSAIRIALQIFSPNSYQGTIYVDEVDIR